jgi:hypothetical protein
MLLTNQPPIVFQVATTKIHGPGFFPTTQAHPHAQPNSPHAHTPLHDSHLGPSLPKQTRPFPKPLPREMTQATPAPANV